MKEANIILVGLPGDMPTRIGNIVNETKNVNLAKYDQDDTALTGEEIKGKKIDDKFIADYYNSKGIHLIPPEDHEKTLVELKKGYKDSLLGINFATVEGHGVNSLFVKYEIPFIYGGTGVDPEEESKLEKAVKESNICAVIDKNMSTPLVVFGAMLKYAGETFPGALKGFSGYGVDSHQDTKKDPISGTFVKWGDAIKKLGVNFVPTKGDRTATYGHGDHFIRIASPDGKVKLTFQTEVLERDTYAQGTVEKALPFLVNAMEKGEKGKVYSMANTLRGWD